jgi:hypothetical protein
MPVMQSIRPRNVIAALCLLLVTQVPLVQAQDPVHSGYCTALGGTFDANGVCSFPHAPAADVPLPPGPWGDEPWFWVPDARGDVRTVSGGAVDEPDLDAVNAYFRDGEIDRAMVNFLGEQRTRIAANDARLRPGDRFVMVVVEVDGDAFGPATQERSRLFGVVTDDGAARNDMPAAVVVSSPFWVGMDAIHQGGQFSTGDRGAGSSRLTGNGAFDGYYNTSSGLQVWSFPETDSYLLLLPTRQVEEQFRIFTQTAVGEEAAIDMVGDARSIHGSLFLDGRLGDALTCAQIVQPLAPEDGEVLVQFRFGSFGDDVLSGPSSLDVNLAPRRGDRISETIPGSADGDGLVFDLHVANAQVYAINDLAINLGSGDDVLTITGDQLFGLLPDRIDVGDRPGVLGGSRTCARPEYWTMWSDLCQVSFETVLATILGPRVDLGSLTLRSGGDDVVSTCLVSDANDIVGVVNVLRSSPDAALVEELFDGYGAQPECAVTAPDWPGYDRVLTRVCEGGQPSRGAMALRDGTLSRLEFRGTGDPETLRDLAGLLEPGDLDGDGILDHLDDDADGDGIPYGSDFDQDNDGVMDSMDARTYVPG